MQLLTNREDPATDLTINLNLMGLEGRTRNLTPRVAPIQLLDKSWVIQQRGIDPPRRRFRGSIPVGGRQFAMGIGEWEKLVSVVEEKLRLYDQSAVLIATGYIIGGVNLEEPDLIGDVPVVQRWRFEFIEESP